MKFKFKKNAKVNIGTEDPWYALTDGGYFQPHDVLKSEEQASQVLNAIDLVYQFIEDAYDAGVLEEA